jgi:site-specific recombinase XerD
MLDTTALVPIDLALPGDLVPFEAEVASARRYAQAGKAPSTVAGYQRDYAAFARWCSARGLLAMPATTDTVILHVTALADGGLSVSSIGRRLAAVTYAHKLGRAENPCTGDDLREVLAGVRRTLGTAPRRKAAATADRIRAMLDACDTSTTLGLRDRAILALGFAGAFRRSELVALTMADLTEVPDGYRVLIRRSKTDQTGEGAEIVIPRGLRIRPVEAVQAWLEAAGITEGLLFRAIQRGGRVKPQGLRGIDVARAVKRYAAAAGLDPVEFSGHSLRAGFVTSAAESGASILKIQEVSRHKSVDVLSGYVRRVDLFKDHAGAGFL